MRHPLFISTGTVAIAIAIVWPARVLIAGQSAVRAKTTSAVSTYTPPRTANGQPDLQGVWANNLATPLERPKQFADKPVLTDQELTVLKAKAEKLFATGAGDAVFGDGLYAAVLADSESFVSTDGKTGDYNQFWLVDREWENRTSLIIDPPDGKVPAMTPEAQKRQAAAGEYRRLHPADGPEDMGQSLRCLTYGAPRLGGLTAGYNSYYQIVQTPDYVAIHAEMFHETRIVWLNGRQHLPPTIRQWLGDSRGHWEGNTLVVDTTNFSPESNYRGAHENLHVIERITRVGPATLDYQVTIDDPTTWIRPWTGLVHLKASPDHIYEYACHEGNIAMGGILRGARVEEKAAADDAKKGSN